MQTHFVGLNRALLVLLLMINGYFFLRLCIHLKHEQGFHQVTYIITMEKSARAGQNQRLPSKTGVFARPVTNDLSVCDPPTSLEYDDMVCGIVAQFTTCTILVSGADPEGGVSVGGWGGVVGGRG